MPENADGTDRAPSTSTTIHQLVRLMKRYDLTAIDLVDGPDQDPPAASRRRDARPRLAAPRPARPRPRPPTAPAPARLDSVAGSPGPAPDDAVIESPMVGTFYASSSPDAPPFVSVGSAVRPDTTVCVIEAMKVFTDIPAGVVGHDHRDPRQERPVGRVRPALVPRPPSLSQRARRPGVESRGRRSVGFLVRRAALDFEAHFGDVPANPGRQPRRDRPAGHPRLPGAGRRGRRRLLAGRPRRPLPRAGRPGHLHRQGPERRQLPEHPPHHRRRRGRRRPGDPPRLRLPEREPALRRGLPELQHRVHRPAPRGDPQAGPEDRGQGRSPPPPRSPASPAPTARSPATPRRPRWPARSATPS